VTVVERASQADTHLRYLYNSRATFPTDTERRAGLSVIAELLLILNYSAAAKWVEMVWTCFT